MSLASRPDRKTTAKLLAAKGLSTRQIAAITGWSFKTIARYLTPPKPVSDDKEFVSDDTPDHHSSTGGEETKQHREEVAAAAAAAGQPMD